MKRKIIIKVYLDRQDKEKLLNKHSVREGAKILHISHSYMFEMLNGEKPVLDKYGKKIQYEIL